MNSTCYNVWNFKTCEILRDIDVCNDLWTRTECTNHPGFIRDTCRKSCEPSCQISSSSGKVQEGLDKGNGAEYIKNF